jgi:ABC-type multidrug transport system ATPase subunit
MGMKMLLNLALCMPANSDLMLLDEPTQNLDPVIRSEIKKEKSSTWWGLLKKQRSTLKI